MFDLFCRFRNAAIHPRAALFVGALVILPVHGQAIEIEKSCVGRLYVGIIAIDGVPGEGVGHLYADGRLLFQFRGKGTCRLLRPDTCRERARAAIFDCLAAHLTDLDSDTLPDECTAADIERYSPGDLQKAIIASACSQLKALGSNGAIVGVELVGEAAGDEGCGPRGSVDHVTGRYYYNDLLGKLNIACAKLEVERPGIEPFKPDIGDFFDRAPSLPR